MSDDAQSQNLKAILGLRGMIVDGLIAPGARVSELLLVEKLGISRTPARIALVQLRNEGLLEALPTGGFVVASCFFCPTPSGQNPFSHRALEPLGAGTLRSGRGSRAYL